MIAGCRLRAILLICLALLTACASPRWQIEPDSSAFGRDKAALKTAVLFTAERKAKIWYPPKELQLGFPKPVYASQVLLEDMRRAMGFVFQDVFEAANEDEARARGAQALIEVTCLISAPLEGSTLTAEIEVRVKSLEGALLLTVKETGKYNHFWTIVDDGAVHNAYVDAFERIIPRLRNSPEIQEYATALPGLIARAKAGEMSETRTASPSPPPQRVQPSSALQIKLDDVYLLAAGSSRLKVESAKRGQECQMVLEYSIPGSGAEKPLDLFEIRQVTYAGNVLVEAKDMVSRAPGSHRSAKKIVLPSNAALGDYELVGILRVGAREITKAFAFTIE